MHIFCLILSLLQKLKKSFISLALKLSYTFGVLNDFFSSISSPLLQFQNLDGISLDIFIYHNLKIHHVHFYVKYMFILFLLIFLLCIKETISSSLARTRLIKLLVWYNGAMESLVLPGWPYAFEVTMLNIYIFIC